MSHSHYDKAPSVVVSADETECRTGWPDILSRLRASLAPARFLVGVEGCSGAFAREIVHVSSPQLSTRNRRFSPKTALPPSRPSIKCRPAA
ncbi:MAG TPA: hypothetical protein VKB88_23440 [Bryobacteraceae bacterium]|nr:hypothetical protein [Bryobacteraceae bacterium]